MPRDRSSIRWSASSECANAGSGDGVALFARRTVGEVAHRVDRLVGRPAGDERANAAQRPVGGEPVGGECGFDRGDDFVRLGHAPLAFLTAGELAGLGPDAGDAVGFERFHLVGHDWGCIVGWGVAGQNPERVLSYTAMSIPHPATLIEGMQNEMPSYIQIFNVPGLAETMLSFNGMASMCDPALPEAMQEEYLAVFSEPGALTATLNWYRGILQSIDAVGTAFTSRVEPPVLFLWGTRELFVNDDVRERQRPHVRSLKELELEGGHSIILEQPEAVVEATLAHIRETRAGSALHP